jgi:hypothetical protein
MRNGKFNLTLKDTSNGKQETYYSEKNLKPRTIYHMVVTCSKSEDSPVSRVSLYINGYIDL